MAQYNKNSCVCQVYSYLIFIAFGIILIITVFIYFLNEKPTCIKCGSKNVKSTGKKRYKENPELAIAASPESYNEVEYKCLNCENTFLERKKTVRVT